MTLDQIFERSMQYITNTGGSPKIEWFDDDHEPIGPMLRKDMKQAGLIYEEDGCVKLVSRRGK